MFVTLFSQVNVTPAEREYIFNCNFCLVNQFTNDVDPTRSAYLLFISLILFSRDCVLNVLSAHAGAPYY